MGFVEVSLFVFFCFSSVFLCSLRETDCSSVAEVELEVSIPLAGIVGGRWQNCRVGVVRCTGLWMFNF